MLGKMQIVPVAAALVLAATLVMGGCAASDKATAPTQQPTTPTPTAASCSPSVSSLAQSQGAVVDCSSGTAITLPGKGASYLIVPNLAVGEVPPRTTSYVIGGTGLSATADVSPLAGNSAAAASVAGVLGRWATLQRSGPGARQRLFDARLRRLTARRLTAGGARLSVAARASMATAPPPPLGTLRDFHVISSLDTITLHTRRITARLEYIGTNIMVYVDTAAPAGFTAADIGNFATTFDQVLYPIDVSNFGPPSDVDQNGHLIMLLTPVVNALTPSSQCDSQGYVAGFFSGGDLASNDTTSNQGEVFYALAPDPAGTFSCAHSMQELEDQLGATFLHEVQHLINFSQHVLVRNSSDEEGWLDEGLSLVAEELGARYYEDKYPAPSGRSNPVQVFPDSAEGYVTDLLLSSYDYLLQPDTVTLTLHSDADGGLEWRGGDWLLLHWLGDQKGGATFYKALVQTGRTGIANIETAAGEPFTSLFGDFSTALYTDSLPGLPKSQVPTRDQFTTRTLRRLYAAVYRVAQGDPSVPYVFPIRPRALPATGTIAATLVPGTMAFYRANSAASASTITITFATPSGTHLPPELQPQVSIFRLPPGQ